MDVFGKSPGQAKIFLLKDDRIVKTFTSGTSWGSGGEGAFNTSMPDNEFGFKLYRVKVVNTTNDKYFGTRPDFISMPIMKVQAPVTNGQNGKVGETHTVT